MLVAFVVVINTNCIGLASKFCLFFFPVPLLYSCAPLFTTIPSWTSIPPATRAPAPTPPMSRTCSMPPTPALIIIISIIILSTMTPVRALFIATMPVRTSTSASASTVPSPVPPKQLASQLSKNCQHKKDKSATIQFVRH